MKLTKALPLMLLPLIIALGSCDQTMGEKSTIFLKGLFGNKKETAAEDPSIETLKPFLASQARKALHLVTAGQNRFSKLGGLPQLPRGQAWPQWQGKSLSFIAQIKFSELNGAGTLPDYPTSGLLYVFYDQEQSTWGFDPKDQGSWQTIYVADETTPLAKAAKPADLENLFAEKTIAGNLIETYPESFDRASPAPTLNDAQLETYFDFRNQAYQDQPQHSLGGYPSPVQNDTMEEQCELTSNQLYTGNETGYNDPKAKALRANAKDWVLLLQIDTDDAANMMWGDAGMLYFWIKKSDLKAKDFSKVWMVLQCG